MPVAWRAKVFCIVSMLPPIGKITSFIQIGGGRATECFRIHLWFKINLVLMRWIKSKTIAESHYKTSRTTQIIVPLLQPLLQTASHRAHAADKLTNNEGDQLFSPRHQLFGSGSVVVCRSEPYKAQTGSGWGVSYADLMWIIIRAFLSRRSPCQQNVSMQ